MSQLSTSAGPVAVTAGHNTPWNVKCTLNLYLAARHDANNHYVTFNVSDIIKSGLVPGFTTMDQFRKVHAQGDVFLFVLGGRVQVSAKVNRKTCDTMAFTCPQGVAMPTWKGATGGSAIVPVEAVVVCYTGTRFIPRENKVLPKPAPEATMAAVPPHLDPILETPAENSPRCPYPKPPQASPRVASNVVQYLVVGDSSTRIYRLTEEQAMKLPVA